MRIMAHPLTFALYLHIHMNTEKHSLRNAPGKIGIFDSGYGGLTILKKIRKLLPEYDYLYFGDNARAPYGTRSFEIVLEFTTEAVKYLFGCGCHLVILACNTASAKALRSIQQNILPNIAPDRRVLGVIRPTVESLDGFTRSRHVGVVATPGTIRSNSYSMEVKKLFPDIHVTGQACPMWVPLIENNEAAGEGADYFVKKYLDNLFSNDPLIDTLVLGCTHYPLLTEKIQKYAPQNMRIVEQGELVAHSLKAYMNRHPEIDKKCTKNGTLELHTTENSETFNKFASLFLEHDVDSRHILL